MSHSTPFVSVITPVYNGEAHIADCIRSIMNQTYKNLEIIIVNDGSTDNSLSIIDQYKQQDGRITCISKPKEGVALARKSGFDQATGKYIQYLDADDTLFSDAIERLVRRAEETDADIIAAPFFFCFLGKHPELSADLQFEELSGVDYYREILNQRAYWSVWSNFHKRSLFTENSVQIPPEIFFGEDAIMMTQLALYARKVASIQEPILYYNQHENSVTYQMNSSKYVQLRTFQKWIRDYLKTKGLDNNFRKELAIMHLQTTFNSIHWRQFTHTRQDMKKLIKILKEFPDLTSRLSHRENKLLSYYKTSLILGDFKLKHYVRKRKI